MHLLNEENRYRVNAFDWHEEFPQVSEDGGFNVIIGNPPYVRQEILTDLKEYFKSRYTAYHGVADLYVYFVERSLELLCNTGIFGMIIGSKWLRAKYGKPLRQF